MKTDHFLKMIIIFLSIYLCHIQAMSQTEKNYFEGDSFNNEELNAPCRNNHDCGTFGYYCAWNKTCQCLDQYIVNYKLKVCLGGIYQKCKYDEHCIKGAYCMNQSTCQCKDRFPIPSYDGLECTSATSLDTSSSFTVGFTLMILIIK